MSYRAGAGFLAPGFLALMIALSAQARPLCKANTEIIVIVTCAPNSKGKYPPWPGPCTNGYERIHGHGIDFNGEIYWPEGQGTVLGYQDTKRIVTARGAFDEAAVVAPCVEAHKTRWQSTTTVTADGYGEKPGKPMFGEDSGSGMGAEESPEDILNDVAYAEAQGRLFIAPPDSKGGRRVASGGARKKIEFEAANPEAQTIAPADAAVATPANSAQSAPAPEPDQPLPSKVEFSKPNAANSKLELPAALPQLYQSRPLEQK